MSQTGFNPAYHRPVRDRMSVDACVKGILSGDRNALSYAITLAESLKEEGREEAYSILAELSADKSDKKPARRITITGAPGAGKSTFIEHFGKFLTSKGHKLAVLAVDPSSQVSQGSIMGDKTRMEALSTDPLAFIRPSSAGAMLGGVNQGTKEAVYLCEKAGFDWILIETVGVGQSESFSSLITDMTILLVQPGAGDDIQGIKRGIMEVTDLMVVNKADGSQKDLAAATARAYASSMQLFQSRVAGYKAGALTASALEESGFDAIYSETDRFFNHLITTDQLLSNRQKQEMQWFDMMLKERLLEWFIKHSDMAEKIQNIRLQMQTGKLSGFAAIEEAMQGFKNRKS